MAHTDEISETALEDITAQIGSLIGSELTQPVIDAPAVVEPEASAPETTAAGSPAKAMAESKTMTERKDTPERPEVSPYTYRLGESFALCILDEDKIPLPYEKFDTDLRDLVRRTGRCHHQIKVDGQAVAYARSTGYVADGKNPTVREIFSSPLAGQIDQAARRVEALARMDSLVRMLVVPSHNTYAFLVINSSGPSQVFIIDPVEKFPGLDTTQLVSSEDFLRALAQMEAVDGFG
jgi:hypothetical protein